MRNKNHTFSLVVGVPTSDVWKNSPENELTKDVYLPEHINITRYINLSDTLHTGRPCTNVRSLDLTGQEVLSLTKLIDEVSTFDDVDNGIDSPIDIDHVPYDFSGEGYLVNTYLQKEDHRIYIASLGNFTISSRRFTYQENINDLVTFKTELEQVVKFAEEYCGQRLKIEGIQVANRLLAILGDVQDTPDIQYTLLSICNEDVNR